MSVWGFDLSGTPQAGVHYPKNELQFSRWFNSEEDARDYLEAVRFRDGVYCPRCGAKNVQRRGETERRPADWWCPDCRHRVSLTTATSMQRTHIPLEVWLRVAWDLTSQKGGAASLTMSRAFDVSYKHTLYLTQKIRGAMAHSPDKLSGTVEIDETFVGGYEEGGQGAQRESSNKATVLVAAERVPYVVKKDSTKPKRRRPTNKATHQAEPDENTLITLVKPGRIRLERVHTNSVICLERFIEANVEPGSTIYTDGLAAYGTVMRRFAERGITYEHIALSEKGLKKKGHELLPVVHLIASLVKRWVLQTHQAGIQEHQLQGYLDEWVFRFNRRNATSRGLVFWRLVCALVEAEHLPRAVITSRKDALKAADVETAKKVEEVRLAERRRLSRQTTAAHYQRSKAARASPPIPISEGEAAEAIEGFA